MALSPLGSSDFDIVAGVLQNKGLMGQKCREFRVRADPSATLGPFQEWWWADTVDGLIFGQSVEFSFVQLCHRIKQLVFFFLGGWTFSSEVLICKI